MPQSNLCHNYDDHIINTALYNSIIDFVPQLKFLTELKNTIQIITDDVTVSDENIFWHKTLNELETKYNIYSVTEPMIYSNLNDDMRTFGQSSVVVIPKVMLNKNVLTIEIICKHISANQGKMQIVASGTYQYDLDCDSEEWVQTKKNVKIMPSSDEY